MAVDRLAQAVREQIAFGRLLPLGGAADAAWITERAAADALRGAVAGLTGIRLGALRIGPEQDAAPYIPEPDADPDVTPDAEPDAVTDPVADVAPGAVARSSQAPAATPPSAVPHGPLCVTADFAAAADRPLPAVADRLRAALWDAAHDLLGLAVTSVDLEVSGLLEPGAPHDQGPVPVPTADGDRDRAGQNAPDAVPGTAGGDVIIAALMVPGVARVTSRLGGFTSGIRTADVGDPPGREVRVKISVVPGHRALDVARAVGEAVTKAAEPGAPGAVTAAVVVTAFG
ncbi:nucleopolyhedrovirus P10 family protein [Streptomyces sp. H10-C2]|uniref:nucleopolyhedrovirus P10 family protein n=1 Tax=unclassified Streptomyces TaxID=2593676 RepID=UPI0024BA5528|nr:MULTISPECIES: nucleopolyhedrovirus P10 family protein [unclassified Streptomyces]MDJ0344828.1 nucleopolyhedrovirus P10 family protein [Streptomyces sp. PH10-H1]MDJ0371888.1 nucleopolyhedrovirus P10 family protein [Streptomyces sp. H10-C2]